MADKGRNAEVDFHGQKRSNETHASVTDPDARLYRKREGKEARLCYMGHALMENRNRLVVRSLPPRGRPRRTKRGAGYDRPRADRPRRRPALGADKGYGAKTSSTNLGDHECNAACGGEGQGLGHCGRTTRQADAPFARIRKRIEEPFGWSKTVGLVAKTMLRGLERVGGQFIFNLAAYNLARLPKLLAA